jgi:hypothetical protein
MFPNPITNQRGMGLITAVFIIVVVGMFGVLIARYTVISSMTSAEDYIWAQALNSAESTMRLNILRHDGGGNFTAIPTPIVGGTTTKIISDNFTADDKPATIRVQALHDTGVSRTVEAKYLLK